MLLSKSNQIGRNGYQYRSHVSGSTANTMASNLQRVLLPGRKERLMLKRVCRGVEFK